MTPHPTTVSQTRPAPAEVACVGDNCVDVAERPGAVELAGGNAFNVAVELARAGRRTAYHGAVGDDTAGAVILAAAHAAGVDVSGVHRVHGATGRTVVAHGPDGDRVFVSEDYGVAAGYRLDAATAAVVGAARWVHFARQADAEDWAPALRAAGARLSCDFGDAADLEAIAPLCRELDVAFLSEPAGDEDGAAALLAGALGTGARLAVVTLGAAGSVARRGGRTWRAPAVPVAPVVDTLGAGDAFIAAFVGAQLRDDADIDAALAAGAAAGAAACTRIGLASPLPPTEVPA